MNLYCDQIERRQLKREFNEATGATMVEANLARDGR
jgi:hypothetical protein